MHNNNPYSKFKVEQLYKKRVEPIPDMKKGRARRSIQADVQHTLQKIPELLGFKDQKAGNDYHILTMNKETITTRICDEMFWLFRASVECY